MTIDEALEGLWDCTLELCKETYEWNGTDMGDDHANIEYRNYLADNPIQLSSPFMFDPSISNFSLNIGALGTFDKYNHGAYNIKNGVNNRVKSLHNLFNIVPKGFLENSIAVGRSAGVPVALFLFIGLSESSFRDCAPNNLGYGGYFGQQTSAGGYGSSFETQAMKNIVPNYRRLLRQGISKADAIGLTYVAHHLPVIGLNIVKDTNGNIWSSDPDELANKLNMVYNKHMKKPMSATRLAEAMTVNLYAAYASKYMTSNPEFQKYL